MLRTPHSVCTGCTACQAACPAEAIRFDRNRNGFTYPVVDKGKCISCDMCNSACPSVALAEADSNPVCYAARAIDRDGRLRCASGGVFAVLADQVVKSGGVVYGCALVERNGLVARHVRCTAEDDIGCLYGSKYVQSDLSGVLSRVKADLIGGRFVLFSGTPCQVAGLKKWLGRDYETLITVDLICHGVPSAKMFARLQSDVTNAHRGNGRLTMLAFRDKAVSWERRAVTSRFENGASFRESGYANGYLHAYLDHLTIRDSCDDCHFNNGRSGADITLGDYWGVGRKFPEFDDDTGCSAVIVHSSRGLEMVRSATLDLKPTEIEDIVLSNPSYRAPRVANRKKRLFGHLWQTLGFTYGWMAYQLHNPLDCVSRGVNKVTRIAVGRFG